MWLRAFVHDRGIVASHYVHQQCGVAALVSGWQSLHLVNGNKTLTFSFIRYTQPGWQFNLPPQAASGASCAYHPDWLPLTTATVAPDEAYDTLAARYADMGYRAWSKGQLTRSDRETLNKIAALGRPTLRDEYRFVNKYWGKPWACLALLQRLLALHQPVREIAAFAKAWGTKRINPYQEPVAIAGYNNFESKLVGASPLVAVIIPTLNRYTYLADVLHDLEQQDYNHFEVIVVDQSYPFDAGFYQQFKLNIRLIRQQEKLLWTARNKAIEATCARYLLFFDDDSRVAPNWISEHLKCLDFFGADISAGVSLAKVGTKVSPSYSYFRWADQFDSGNALVKREVFQKIGLFDEQYNKQRMGDGEFGVRAHLAGLRSISNPEASRVHLKVAEGGLREIGSWDGFRPKKWFAPKPLPSVVFLYKKYYPKSLYKGMMLLGIMLSNVSYRSKGNNKMLLLSVLLTIAKAPVLLVSFLRAKNAADKMLKQDSGIKMLAP